MTRRLVGLGLAVLLALAPSGAGAQPSADTYFHEAAQQYIAGNRAAAQRAVRQGLSVAPDDPRLRALRRTLRQQRRSDARSDQSRRSAGSRPSASQQGGSTDGGSSPSGDGQRSQAQPGARDTSRADAGRPRRRPGPNARPDTATRPDTTNTAPAEQGGTRRALSRAQAGRLLQALEAQERRLLRARRVRATDTAAVEKDW